MLNTEFFFEVEKIGDRLDVFLTKKTEKSRSFISEQIKKGAVKINNIAVNKPSIKLKMGDTISGAFTEKPAMNLSPIEHKLDILFEDEFLLVLNKEQGIITHPAKTYTKETLVHHLLFHLQENSQFRALSDVRPGIVHRLDKGTTGVILISKTHDVLEKLSQAFKDRKVQKEYEALCWGKPRFLEGKYESTIGRDVKNRKKMSSNTTKGKLATTSWKLIEGFDYFSHVKLNPRTGRTHQLRVQLTEAGFPILGDNLYGRKRMIPDLAEDIKNAIDTLTDTLLHAKSLTFIHPITEKEMHIEAPRPLCFTSLLALLKK